MTFTLTLSPYQSILTSLRLLNGIETLDIIMTGLYIIYILLINFYHELGKKTLIVVFKISTKYLEEPILNPQA